MTGTGRPIPATSSDTKQTWFRAARAPDPWGRRVLNPEAVATCRPLHRHPDHAEMREAGLVEMGARMRTSSGSRCEGETDGGVSATWYTMKRKCNDEHVCFNFDPGSDTCRQSQGCFLSGVQ